jgi:alanyl-tRNA synthetase
MLQGKELPETVIVQRCLRTRWNTTELFSFRMFAILGMASRLNDGVAHLFAFLTNEIGLSTSSLHCVVNRNDTDLLGLVTLYLSDQKMHHLNENNHKYWVRWGFGYDTVLTGRGLTIAWEFSNRSSCSPTCSIHCNCNRFLPLGNIVELLHKPTGHRYFDIGFGVEKLASLFYDGDLYSIDILQSPVDSFCKSGMNLEMAQLLTNLYSSIVFLIEEGVSPSNKKSGYVLRKMIRSIVELLYIEPCELIVESLTAATNCYLYLKDDIQYSYRQTILSIIVNECLLYIKSIDRGKQKARIFLKKNKGKTVDDLHKEIKNTFGLPRIVIDDLFLD